MEVTADSPALFDPEPSGATAAPVESEPGKPALFWLILP